VKFPAAVSSTDFLTSQHRMTAVTMAQGIHVRSTFFRSRARSNPPCAALFVPQSRSNAEPSRVRLPMSERITQARAGHTRWCIVAAKHPEIIVVHENVLNIERIEGIFTSTVRSRCFWPMLAHCKLKFVSSYAGRSAYP
jgi:hypothetical protein